MKHKIRIVLAAMLLAIAMLMTAGASNYEHCADQLKALGLFQGTEQGYELDRVPTRAEAAAMLVRLLGKEIEAQKLAYTAPFTDLDDWQKPYVQYLYDAGLTSGATATTFDPASPCSAQMYTTFLLRALGYSDAEAADFSYEDAIAFGQSIGLVDYANCDTQNFLRDHIAAMSLTALHTAVKDAQDTVLLEKLVADGAVAQADAKELLAFFDGFDAYAKASSAMSSASKMDMTIDMDVDASMSGTQIMTMQLPLRTKMDMNLEELDQSRMEMTGTATIKYNEVMVEPGESTTQKQKIAYYYTDGTYYINVDGQKSKQAVSFDQAVSQLGSLSAMQKTEPICMMEEIKSSGSAVTLRYSAASMNELVNTILQSMNMSGMAGLVQISDMTAAITVASGSIKSMDIDMLLTVSVQGMPVDMDIDMACTINKIGSGITISLPTDLNTYEEVIGGADAPAA